MAKANQEGIQKIIVRVASLTKAKNFLMQSKMLGTATNRGVMIDPDSIGGLEVEVTDK